MDNIFWKFSLCRMFSLMWWATLLISTVASEKKKKISSSQIKEVKRLPLHVQNTFNENLFGSQVKKKSRQSKRQFEFQGRREGGSTYGSLGRGFATEAFKPWPCFRQKPFILLPCSRPYCTANIHLMVKVSGPERHPVVSLGSHFCLVKQYSSPTMDLM